MTLFEQPMPSAPDTIDPPLDGLSPRLFAARVAEEHAAALHWKAVAERERATATAETLWLQGKVDELQARLRVVRRRLERASTHATMARRWERIVWLAGGLTAGVALGLLAARVIGGGL